MAIRHSAGVTAVDAQNYNVASPWRDAVLARLEEMDRHLRRRAAALEIEYPGASRPHAKYPGRSFDYDHELEVLEDLDAPQPERVLDEVAGFFRGAQRPESRHCLFNLNVLPSVDATAAACLSVTANVNGLMDAFGGEALLFEQKVARTIGRWAGWPQAMGISCSGGKSTMLYALRCAVARADPQAPRAGITRRIAVLCSAGAHYSVEHVAAMAGLGAEAVRRVPLDHGGSMRPDALARELEALHGEGVSVGAVVCCGGTVIDFCCDDLGSVWETVRGFATRRGVPMPYLHFDSVVGWPHLALRGMPEPAVADILGAGPAERPVRELLRRTRALDRFDSLGVDFHKSGLCPYASSFFIARDRHFMDDLGDGSYTYGDGDLRSGAFRAYPYTLENTRQTHGTLSAWVNLVALGREGYGRYLAGLYAGCDEVRQALRRHGRFEPLNEHGLGWEVLFDVPQPPAASSLSYREFAIAFMEHCWSRVLDGHGLPLFSIVPEFLVDHQPERARIAFVIYPMDLRDPNHWDWVVKAISDELDAFVARGEHSTPADFRRPIR